MTFLPLKRSESDVARHYANDMKELTRIEYFGDRKALGCIRQIIVGSSVCSVSLLIYEDQVLSGSPFGACLWDIDSGKLIRGPLEGDASVSSHIFGTSTVVMIRDGVVDEWDTDTDRLDRTPIGDIGRVTSVAIDDEMSYYATGFEDGAVRLWDLRNKMTIGEPLIGHSGKVLALSFDKVDHQYLASGSEDQNIVVWHVGSPQRKYLLLKGHSGPITSLAFTEYSEKLASGSLDGTIRLWDVSSGETLHAFCANKMGGVHSVANLDNRYILSGSVDGMIRMWDTKYTEIPPKKFIGHKDKVISLAAVYTDRGKHFASGSEDGTI